MRRGSAQSFSKLSVIFLLLSAFFNLTSYTFDQIIIHNEDKTRHLKQSLEIKRSDLYNLNTSLNVAQDLSYEIGFEANKFLSLISFDAKANGAFINEEIFVDNLILNIEALDTDTLSKTYKNKLIKNINARDAYFGDSPLDSSSIQTILLENKDEADLFEKESSIILQPLQK